MKIKEVTNPEEQLGLLRVIIDNTWSAIKQQADAQARQKASQPAPKTKSKAPKPAPYAPVPKPLPNAKSIYQGNPQHKAQPMATQAHKLAHKQMPINTGAPNLANNKQPNPVDALKTNKEKDELINPLYGALPRKAL